MLDSEFLMGETLNKVCGRLRNRNVGRCKIYAVFIKFVSLWQEIQMRRYTSCYTHTPENLIFNESL